jgi:hypothetical protein
VGTHEDLDSIFSRTGSTHKLAAALADELRSRGHAIEFEVIKPAMYCCLLREVSRDFPRYPSILFSLATSSWRRHHIETYNQVEQDIQSLKYPDVSEFDRICIGGPKGHSAGDEGRDTRLRPIEARSQ